MAVYSQGEIILVDYPFTDGDGGKKRPAIIISNSSVNASQDVIVAMVTTQQVDNNFAVQLEDKHITNPWKGAYTCNVHCKKILTIAKTVILKKISKVKDDNKLNEILNTVTACIIKEKTTE